MKKLLFALCMMCSTIFTVWAQEEESISPFLFGEYKEAIVFMKDMSRVRGKLNLYRPTGEFYFIDEQDKNAFMTTVYKLDKAKGLDLILHTPGGDIAATESIVTYLKSIFKGDVRAFIPQISMSAGTMIAMSCKEIIMGEQSSLGPIDPQMGGIACQAVTDEFKRAVDEVSKNPASLGLWQTIISKYHPTFLTACENAVAWSAQLAEQWLREVDPAIDFKKNKKKS